MVQIRGVVLTDDDVQESCGWENQKCTSLDVTVYLLTIVCVGGYIERERELY